MIFRDRNRLCGYKMRMRYVFVFLVLGMTGCFRQAPETEISRSESTEQKPASSQSTGAETLTFTVMAYNVENLFDADGVALFDDYRPGVYGPRQMATKIRHAVQVVAEVDGGTGPDILLVQECEGDQTPNDWSGNLEQTLEALSGKTVDQHLSDNHAGEWAGLPSYVWLAKALQDAGLGPYEMAVADYSPPPDARSGPVHVNVTFSRFPITDVGTHHTAGARSILETVHDIAGYDLICFNNHWKSGASNPETEPIRVGNAMVLKRRVDVLLTRDEAADLIIGGDLNAHYNQSALFPQLAETGINSVLQSQGDELAIRGQGPNLLYNLWFELPFEQRGSELYRGEWGTLMHLIVSPGLYDYQGIQFVDQSFEVLSLEGINRHPITQAPVSWAGAGDGAGYSDHFPVLARFRTVEEGDPDRFLDLERPSRDPVGPSHLPIFDYSTIEAEALPMWNTETEPSVERMGQFFRVQSTVVNTRPFQVEVAGRRYGIWVPHPDLRPRVYDTFRVGNEFDFVGEFGRHRGNWQFVIHDGSWIKHVDPATP